MSCLSCLVFICVHCFWLKMMKLFKDICSAWISRTSAEFFLLIDWRHKRLKNTTDLLLFYGEHFYGFSESDLMTYVSKGHIKIVKIYIVNFNASISNRHFKCHFKQNCNHTCHYLDKMYFFHIWTLQATWSIYSIYSCIKYFTSHHIRHKCNRYVTPTQPHLLSTYIKGNRTISPWKIAS